jgi:type VI protein secretion system component Hcp
VVGYNRLAQVAQKKKTERSTSTVTGKLGVLRPGEHTVRIAEVDMAKFIDDGSILFIFESSNGSMHRQRIFTLSKDNQNEYSTVLISFINALFNDADIWNVLEDIMINSDVQDQMFNAFKHLQLKITIDTTSGYLVLPSQKGYTVLDAQSKQYIFRRYFKTVSDAKQAALEAGHRPSYLYVKSYEALNDSVSINNRKTFDAVIQGISTATKDIADYNKFFGSQAFEAASTRRRASSVRHGD